MKGSKLRTRLAGRVILLQLLLTPHARGAMVTWQLKQDPSTPGTRFQHAATYDAARHLTVIFGGYKGVQVNGETWGWDGTTWTLLAPANPNDPNTPSPRYATAMTYYTKPGGGDGILLFGGSDANNVLLGDTYEFDGANRKWKKLAPATSPSARNGSAMAYDSTLGNVILFGGGDQSATGLSPNDTWGWDGSNWTKLTSGMPPPRAGHVFAYDDARQKMVLFGGYESGLSVRGDTWEFDATGWHQRCTPTPCPIPPRFFAAMAYDRQQQQTILLGGSDASGKAHSDAFAFNGATWGPLAPGGGGGPRTGHVLAFDGARNRMVLFAGLGAADLADTREALFSGQPCTTAATCETGFCVDGVCCQTSCTGVCRRCDEDNDFLLLRHVHAKDGMCRIPLDSDPDHECGADLGCGGTCGPSGQCEYGGNDTSCGLCASCNRRTGKCDQLPASGDDVNCPPARCGLASHQCRTYFDQSVSIKRCLAVGRCGWRWEDCTSFQDNDGAPCFRILNDPPEDGTSVCSAGLCQPR